MTAGYSLPDGRRASAHSRLDVPRRPGVSGAGYRGRDRVLPGAARSLGGGGGNLSGGEQQMLSLAQAFIARPKLLMIDELSLGLAPTVVEQLVQIVPAIHAAGTAIILVEQSVSTSLRLAERAVFMEKGEIRFSGATAELLERRDLVRSVFLHGAASAASAGSGAPGGSTEARSPEAQRERASVLEAKPVVLEVCEITKRYGGLAAVADVSFSLHEGEILGLIGPNGAGKTTILDLVSGFQDLNAGQVLLDGEDVTGLAPHARARRGLGRSFQSAILWPSLTVAEAIATGCEPEVAVRAALPAFFRLPVVSDSEADIAARVDELIDLLGLGDYRDKFVGELSTGTRRVVDVGVQLASRPFVLMLDEPSSGIAQRETEALGPLLRSVQAELDCSLLVIEHDMTLLSGLADRLVALDAGEVIAVGTPADVLAHPAVVESYLGRGWGEREVPAGPP
ncbi:MAG: ATP-binding cassette domain-containing protein [Acidimicrobiia bacterium]|nr:ATP-binding cassette domain-containing protein [Acidimicrobiia bacterium]